MEIVVLLLRQNLVMLVYMMIGYFLYKKKLVSAGGSADIGRILLYIVMPAAILKSYLADFSRERLEGLFVSFLAALLSLLLSIAAARIAFSKEQGIERFGAAFSNAGFIGIPLVQMTLGEEAVFYVSSYVALLNILQWTYGLVTITGDRSLISVKRLRINPILLSFLAGIALFLLPVSLPETAENVVGTIAAMNGPLAMIVLGVYLGQVPLRSLFSGRVVYRCALVRLIVIPVLTMALLFVFPEKYHMLKLTILIAASAPVGSNVSIFAQLYGQDYMQSVKEVTFSTLLCIITLPLILGIADYVL
ncbi:MAG: AEC family transporter [Schaedlerella sp.]|uniref:AEC family transporter n=1 Tax=Schaedlerella sp. TaxID=2676057 RepID=UPI0035272D15